MFNTMFKSVINILILTLQNKMNIVLLTYIIFYVIINLFYVHGLVLISYPDFFLNAELRQCYVLRMRRPNG